MPDGTRVGHVHLHVNDLAAARAFYTQVIGFGDMRAFERIGMSDFSLNTSFVPHALAINTWNGRLATPRPVGSSGLIEWELVVSVSGMDAVKERLMQAGAILDFSDRGFRTQDPAGNVVHLIAEQ
jgi:catechol 2,3-dioxygenase